MIDIDGSMYSGSGTLLRYSVALATLKREDLRISRIRSKRPKPGLRAQHVSAVKACAALTGGRLEGAEVGSESLFYRPGREIIGGRYQFDIGTAGSATMAAFTLIPPALFATGPCRCTITGGLFQDFAPSFFHMQMVLVPLLVQMGADLKITMTRPGYVPKGGGILVLEVNPCRGLEPLQLIRQGNVNTVEGIALASRLRKQKVAERMAARCRDRLQQSGYTAEIRSVEDSSAIQSGAALAIRAQTDTGCLLGADRAGKVGRKSEAIADFVVHSLLKDLRSGACTDRHVADQLILFGALAHGTTEYSIPRVTEHIESNLWLVKEILGVSAALHGNRLTIKGIDLTIS